MRMVWADCPGTIQKNGKRPCKDEPPTASTPLATGYAGPGLPELVLTRKTLLIGTLVLVAIALALLAWRFSVSEFDGEYSSVSVRRIDDPSQAPTLTSPPPPFDYDEASRQCPDLANAMQEAADQGQAVVFKQSQVKAIAAYLDRTYGEDAWTREFQVTWNDQTYAFHASSP